MAFTARSIPVGPLVLDAQAVLARLPAEARARIAWTQKPINDALKRLRTEPLTDALLAEASEQVMVPVTTIASAMWKSMVKSADELRALLMQDFERGEQSMSAFLDDEDARDTLRWVMGLLRSFYGSVFALLAVLPPGHLGELDADAFTSINEDEEGKALMRGLVALMAVWDEAQHGEDRARARDLLDMAFLNLNAFRNAARKRGFWVAAPPFETLNERRERLRHYADRLRDTLSDDDMHRIEQARMQSIR